MVQIGARLLAEIELRPNAVQIAPSLWNTEEVFADTRAGR